MDSPGVTGNGVGTAVRKRSHVSVLEQKETSLPWPWVHDTEQTRHWVVLI